MSTYLEIEDHICKVRGILNNVMDAHADRHHEHLTAALWAADGLLEDAMKTIEGGYKNETSPYNDLEFKAELDEVFSKRAAEEQYYLQENAEEGDEEAEDGEGLEDDTRFNVEMIKEHEDGSATFQVSGSKASMQKLFETFFCSAVVNGILMTEKGNERYSAQQRALDAARDLEVLLEAWETSDDLDYDPVVKNAKRELANALRKVNI